MSQSADHKGVGPRLRGPSGEQIDATRDTSTLTAAEIEFLAEHGGVPVEVITSSELRRLALTERERSTRADWEKVLASSLTTAALTARFGWSSTKVSRLIRDRDLFTVTGVGPKRLNMFPSWQFTKTGVIPGLRHVLPHLPMGWLPSDVGHWMTTQNEGLPHSRTPIECLVQGHPEGVVAALEAELMAW